MEEIINLGRCYSEKKSNRLKAYEESNQNYALKSACEASLAMVTGIDFIRNLVDRWQRGDKYFPRLPCRGKVSLTDIIGSSYHCLSMV